MSDKIRILVDTNFFISVDAGSGRGGYPIEASLDQTCIEISSLANRNGIPLCLSKATAKDLEKGEDAVSMIKKMNKYQILGSNYAPDDNYWKSIGTASKPGTNNYIDDCILNALNHNAANFLVTTDQGIHRKAIKLGIDHRVLTPEKCLEILKGFYEPDYKIFNEIKEVEMSSIPLNQPIFDSLRSDYEGFDDWYANKSRLGRKAWIIGDPKSLEGIAIYDPNNGDYDGEMKICTFKVDEVVRGSKLGELLMKQVLETAFKRKKRKLYVEFHTNRDDLKSFFSEFGFEDNGIKKTSKGLEQCSFVRKIQPQKVDYEKNTPVEFLNKFYPYFIEPPSVNSYIVPIQPEFAQTLFADSLPQQSFGLMNPISNRVIRKIYVSNGVIRKMKKGDILFFYISGKHESIPTKVIVTMGIIDDILVTDDVFRLWAFAGKRTVYTTDELNEFVANGKVSLAVKFWHVDRIKAPIPFEEISTDSIKISSPQSFATLPPEAYTNIIQHKNFI